MFFSFILYGTKYLLDSKFKKLRLFILYLSLMVLVEILAIVFLEFNLNTNLLYNLLSFFEFNILVFFYHSISENELTIKLSKIIFFTVNVGLVLSVLSYGVANFHVVYNTIAPVIGGVLVSVMFFLYLREILLSEEILNYKKNIFFWITTGLLLYYLGTLPLTAIFNLMKRGSGFTNLYNLQFLLIIVMHSCFILGILWNWKRIK